MPKFSNNPSNTIFSQNYTLMEIEGNAPHQDIIKINVDNIQDEVIESGTGYTYTPGQLSKCFIPQNDLAKEITLLTLKMFLINVKIKASQGKVEGTDELYIINKTWYEQYKIYSRYSTIKRAIILFSTYASRPIYYTPAEKFNPGIINNKDLYIKNKINSNDGRNLLVSKNNNAYDTRFKVGLIQRDRFNLLKNYFKCDMEIKLNQEGSYNIINNKNYEYYCVHLNAIFIPTMEIFKSVNDENYEEFYKKYNIIYDLYFRQNSRGDEIINELKSIIKERPELLSNMGVKFITEGQEDEIMNHFNFLKYYIPYISGTKTKQEILDFILSKSSVDKIKNNLKISSEDIPIRKNPYFYNNISTLFKLKLDKKNNNIDEVKNGLIIIEYIPVDKSDEVFKFSIFEEEKNPPKEEEDINKEYSSYRYNNDNNDNNNNDNSNNNNKTYRKEYNLDDYPLNEKENKNGLVGLNNLGNTCYMNTGIQCLSNCELLTKYFLGNYYKNFINKENPIGSNGEIVEKYSQLIHHLWQGNEECISPIQFKKVFGKMYNNFDNYRQQDSQEFISYLLDSLHEDLNKVLKKPYIESKDLSNELSDEEIFKI